MTLDAHGGNTYAYDHVRLDFSVNLNPLGMPTEIEKAICDHVKEYDKYPDTNCRQLKAAAAAHLGVPESYFCFGNGAADLIIRICSALKPKKALVPAPTFSEYEAAVRMAGGETEHFILSEEENFRLTERYAEAVASDTDLVFLCNPNNPTCRVTDYVTVRKTAEACAACGAYLVIDECFIEFTDGTSAIGLLSKFPNIILLRAFTKIYSMAGLRLGYLLCADGDTVSKIAACGQSWSVSTPAQAAGVAALSLSGFCERTKGFVKGERAWLADEMKKLPIKLYPSEGNFLLFRSKSGLWDAAMERGIMLRSCANYIGLDDRYYRIGIKNREDNLELLKVLGEILQ